MDAILSIIAKIIGTIVGAAAIYLIREALKYLRASMDEKDRAKLDAFISSLVAAADQMYKAQDSDGSIRLGYVQDMLVEAGYDLTDAIRALIESKVHELNASNPKTEATKDE